MTVTFIRKTLWSLYYRRRHTIKRMLEGGRCMREESKALEALKIQLQASESWSLKQHIAMVHGLRSQISTLLSLSFHKEREFRNKIVDLMIDCQSIQQQPTLF